VAWIEELRRATAGKMPRPTESRGTRDQAPLFTLLVFESHRGAGWGDQATRSNWLRRRSHISIIISTLSESSTELPCMITAFHVSPSGRTEMAKSVGKSEICSISTRMAASNSDAVLLGFFIGAPTVGLI